MLPMRRATTASAATIAATPHITLASTLPGTHMGIHPHVAHTPMRRPHMYVAHTTPHNPHRFAAAAAPTACIAWARKLGTAAGPHVRCAPAYAIACGLRALHRNATYQTIIQYKYTTHVTAQ